MLVWPKDETMRKLLRHPSNQVGFRPEGPIDWPDDTFTARRIADGDVLTSDPNAAAAEAKPNIEVPASGEEKPAEAEHPADAEQATHERKRR
jgi:hypothetical protein